MGTKLDVLTRMGKRIWRAIRESRAEAPVGDSWRARYNAYIYSDAWRLVRGRVLLRADHRCEWVARTGNRCKATRGLQVHHLHYRNLGHEPLEDLLALCPKHHAMADRRREREVEAARKRRRSW
jgi:hypothetical protein